MSTPTTTTVPTTDAAAIIAEQANPTPIERPPAEIESAVSAAVATATEFNPVANVETTPAGKPRRKVRLNPSQPEQTPNPAALPVDRPFPVAQSTPARLSPAIDEASARDAMAETTAEQTDGRAVAAAAVMSVEDFVVYQTATVAQIVEKICTQHADASTRNIEIGRDALILAMKEKEVSRRYTATDLDAMVDTIRNRVRLRLAIKPESIKVMEWIKVYLLREQARPIMGDDMAESISITEGIHLTPEVMTFDKTTLTAAFKERWVDFLRHLAAERRADFAATNGSKFEAMLQEWRDRLAAEDKASSDKTKTPEQLAELAAAEARKTTAEKVKRANTAVTSSVANALKSGDLSPAQVAACVETAAAETGKPLSAFLGVNPATITVAECRIFAETMARSGKLPEMRALRVMLSKLIDYLDAEAKRRNDALNTACTSMQPAEAAA